MSMLLILILLVMPFAYAATIYGTIYDLILEPEANVFVEINTIPKQTVVAKTGEYSFNVPEGNYIIYAYTNYSYVKEPIKIEADGDYQIDIILSDIIDEPIDFSLTDDVSVSSESVKESNSFVIWVVIIAVVILIAVLFAVSYVISKHKKEHQSEIKHIKEEISKKKSEKDSENFDEYTKKILQYIKHEKQTTQKEVRKQVPLSEAKVSLIISDLEDRGKIRKIKKGRGNIIIYVKE